MGSASFTVQTGVYLRKLMRIYLHERSWRPIAFAFVIAFIVAAVVGGDMFKDYESTKSGFFSITSAAVWIGIFNSVQSVCREHGVIRCEYRCGLSLTAYLTAQALCQLMICAVQSVIIFAAAAQFTELGGEGIITSAWAEYLITVLLLCFGADIMGLLISCAARDAAAAMTIMPFVLIIQLIMSGVLFDLSGWSEVISEFTLSRWGMSAFGSIADLNDPALPLRLAEAFPNITRLAPESCYEHSAENLINAWVSCAGITAGCFAAAVIVLRIKNRSRYR